ncbi:hypothetical protein BDV37DRAFT_261238 [Aspergillus pseudonomiae]|uniref:Uncharacterized protein n=1 Tax=Aspergillus pseudonomiae TaxID=1506151 RepID=A0A5N7CYJ0_9EURO|nr:uncharacterized protein BDV37DRAFT_261238 [Aspergillus pseudonomiae]KAE8399221.1 hypothetical protein BDV37DRAFT_261238 [Aspergillus pseudonomiae]
MAPRYPRAITVATILISPAEMPTISVGKCAWSCGLTICTCTGFKAQVQEPLTRNLPSIKCPRCHHTVSDHGRTTSLATSHDVGPASVEKTANHEEKGHELPFVSHRTDTVKKLADLIDRVNVVHVRGTPASGKTTLARLLQKYFLDHNDYKDRKRAVYFISDWRKLEEYSTNGDGETWANLTQMIPIRFGRARNLSEGTVILVDEAQKTYSDSGLWNTIIKDRVYGNGEDIKVCLFCSYGSPSTGVDRQPNEYTPAFLNPEQRVTITPQPSSPPIGLFFTADEFRDAVQQICANPRFEAGFTLDNDAQDYLFSLTNGHPGGVESLLRFFHHYYRARIKHDPERWPLTDIDVVNSLRDENNVWKYLEYTPIYRSLARGSELSSEVSKILRHVLEQGNIAVNEQEDIVVGDISDTDLKKAKRQCYVNGWLHRILVPEDMTGEEKYVLPSRLHEKWVEWILGKKRIPLNPRYAHLRDLCVDILKEFSAATLRHTADGKVLTSGAQYKPFEAAYQDECYRCFGVIAGKGVPICSEWSRTKSGRVDFWISEKKWAVELLREEDRVQDHISRFYKGGQYYSWTTDGMIQDWVIINCATSPPTGCKFI